MATASANQRFAPGYHDRLHQYLERQKLLAVQQSNHVSPMIGPLKDTDASPLLVLPPEMRLKIYEELVDIEEPDDPQLGTWCQHKIYHTNIYASCKELRHEQPDLADKFVLLVSLGPDHDRDGHSSIKTVFNGRDALVEPRVILKAPRTLVLAINIEGQNIVSSADFERMLSLNNILHVVSHELRTANVQKLELTIAVDSQSPFNDSDIRSLLSPAISMAMSAPQATFDLTPAWPDLMGTVVTPSPEYEAVYSQTMRPLLRMLQDLRKEAKLFNKLHNVFHPKQAATKKCPNIDSEFESHRWADGGMGSGRVYVLKDVTALQRSIDRGKGWLEQRESVGYDRAVQKCVDDLKEMHVLQAARKLE